MTISGIVLAITGVFGGGGTGGSTPKDKGILKKWLDRLANALKRLKVLLVQFQVSLGRSLDLLLNIHEP